MVRVTENQLEVIVQGLNKLTGNPITSYTKQVSQPHFDYAKAELHYLSCLTNSAPVLLKVLKKILVWDSGNLPGDLLDEAQQAVDKAEGRR